MEKNRFIHYGGVLFSIAFLSALILSVVNGFTSKVIEENAKKVVTAARMVVLPIADDFREGEAVEASGVKFIPGFKDGELKGYVVTSAENGYAGPIEFVLGFTQTGEITGLDIIGTQETPGLGSKITNQEWKDLWKGRDGEYTFDKSVDAFAGATISPQAVYTGIMKVLKTYESEVKK